ncbi:MAG: dienelactone hydrolase family protein [Luteolibacter sp.]
MKTIDQHQLEPINQYVRIPADDVFLMADLQVPEESNTLVIFAYDCGRSRNHPRALHVARVMRSRGLGTLLCDLLTEEEEGEDEIAQTHNHDAALLSKRLIAVTKWAVKNPGTKQLRMAYFGVSAGGGAALIAAAKMQKNVAAVVSRGGRLDLAAKSVPHVMCPTLLVVGEDDTVGLELNREAFANLTSRKEIKVIPGASHLFGEPGKLEVMAQLSADWIHSHLMESAH